MTTGLLIALIGAVVLVLIIFVGRALIPAGTGGTALRSLIREPALLTGLATAGLGLLVLFHVAITKEQIGGIIVFLGAVVAVLRFLVTPTDEVAVQVKPGQVPTAGPAAEQDTGTPVAVVPAA